MFVLVSFGELAVSVCQSVTLGNLACEPVCLVDVSVSRVCICLCKSRKVTFSRVLLDFKNTDRHHNVVRVSL